MFIDTMCWLLGSICSFLCDIWSLFLFPVVVWFPTQIRKSFGEELQSDLKFEIKKMFIE